MTALPTNTPKETVPIEHFIVRFKDGTVKKVTVTDGDGFFRESFYRGDKGSFTTFECFIAAGESRDIPSGSNK